MAAPRSIPSASEAEISIEGRRLKRDSSGVAEPSEGRTSAEIGTSAPVEPARTYIEPRSSAVRRTSSRACRITGYSRPRSIQPVTSRPAKKVCSVAPMSSMEMPRSSASARSTSMRSSGWVSS